jgi:hypothetical protein
VRKKRAKNVYHPTIKSKLSDRKRECMCRYLKTDHAHWVSLLLLLLVVLLLVVVAVALLFHLHLLLL